MVVQQCVYNEKLNYRQRRRIDIWWLTPHVDLEVDCGRFETKPNTMPKVSGRISVGHSVA